VGLLCSNEVHLLKCSDGLAIGLQFKLVVDGHWTYSADHPTMQDGENVNNVLEVSFWGKTSQSKLPTCGDFISNEMFSCSP
jgi:hypothetical protein